MKRTKIVAFVLGLATAITMWNPNNVVSAETKSVPDGYTPIYTVEDLYGINDDLSGNYILMKDIDLSETKPGGDWDSGNGWTPIGGGGYTGFSGTFDGNGYRISNMTCYTTGEENKSVSFALFNFIDDNGCVNNLGLVNMDIKGKDRYSSMGGIAIRNRGIIEKCYVTGTIQGGGSIGGVVVYNDNIVRDCYTDVEIADKSESKNQNSATGGIVGLQNCYKNSNCVENCYVLGNITYIAEDDDYYINPIIGHMSNSAICSRKNLYCISSIKTGKTFTGVSETFKKLTKAQMKSQKCFTGFDFENAWVVDKNSSYPYPQLRNCMQVRTESIELLSAPDKLDYTSLDTKLDLTGSELKINYEDDYAVTVPLDESMLSYKMKEGNQTVTVKYNNCKTSFKINVNEAEESLIITKKKTKLKAGSSYTYKVKYVGTGKVHFLSSNSRILTIDQKTGKASAKKAGKATIIVKAGKLKKTIKVTVTK